MWHRRTSKAELTLCVLSLSLALAVVFGGLGMFVGRSLVDEWAETELSAPPPKLNSANDAHVVPNDYQSLYSLIGQLGLCP